MRSFALVYLRSCGVVNPTSLSIHCNWTLGRQESYKYVSLSVSPSVSPSVPTTVYGPQMVHKWKY